MPDLDLQLSHPLIADIDSIREEVFLIAPDDLGGVASTSR